MNLKESNKAIIKSILTDSQETRDYRRMFTKQHGFDPLSESDLPVKKSNFSWKKVAEKQGMTLREAIQSTAFVQVLRAGVQQIANSAYENAPVTYDEWVHTVPSNKDTELYAPLQGVSFPNEVPAGGLFPEVNVAGLDLKLQNREFGSMLAITNNLLEDDQTGQFQKQAALMGEYLRLLTEVLCYAKLASPSGGVTYLNYKVPVSETQPSSEAVYPWTPATTAFVGGGFNRPATFGALTQANIQNGIQSLMGQKNLLGIIMQVAPNKLLHSPKYRFDMAVLLNSSYYPSGAAAAGVTGGAFAINPIQSILEPVCTRWMPKNTGVVDTQSTAWYLVDSSKPWFVMQLREAINVVQEAANSGQSFDRKIIRFRADMRGNADFIDPRFAWQGNDGSV